MKRNTYILFFIFLSCVSAPEQKASITLITADELSTLIMQEEVLIVDVRTSEERSLGMIRDALPLDYYDKRFVEKISELNKEKPVVLYCASGIRSARASAAFSQNGFTQVYDLKGGLRAWQLAGYEIVEPK